MNRLILTPAALPPAALAELKQWLGVTTGQDDAELTDLLTASLDICEGFTGQMPLVASCEEMLPVCGGWLALATRPVLTIAGVSLVAADGTRTALAAGAYESDLAYDGTGRVRLLQPLQSGRIAVRFTAGLAASWDDLASSLRHGLIRLAAHQHRQRENSGASALPPTSVAALWRPWRRLRLA